MPTLTPVQVAEDLQISRSTVLQYIHAGNLPFFKVGHRWRIEVRDFEAWKEARKIQSGAWDPYRIEPGSPAHIALVANAKSRMANLDPLTPTPRSQAIWRGREERARRGW